MSDLIQEPRATPDGHYYSPIPRLADLLADSERLWPAFPKELPGIGLNHVLQRNLAREIGALSSNVPWQYELVPGLRYASYDKGRNQYFRTIDARYLSGMLQKLQPSQIIEVGCGYSTAAMLDTSERFLSPRPHITCIDLEMERMTSLLVPGDREQVTVYPIQVQHVPFEVFDVLEANDLLFIDSSHIAKCGSDVNYLLFDILPRLASGVYIHFHDIYWPFEYPLYWLEHGIHFNEAYVLHALLTDTPRYEIVLWADYLERFYSENDYAPDHVDAHSLYLRVR